MYEITLNYIYKHVCKDMVMRKKLNNVWDCIETYPNIQQSVKMYSDVSFLHVNMHWNVLTYVVGYENPSQHTASLFVYWSALSHWKARVLSEWQLAWSAWDEFTDRLCIPGEWTRGVVRPGTNNHKVVFLYAIYSKIHVVQMDGSRLIILAYKQRDL